jgi:hypothetical protein
MLHSIVWFWTTGIHDAAWVQAISSTVLVLLSLVTLCVLAVYAWDTHTLAKSSVEQARNAQMPFLALINIDEELRRTTFNQLSAFLPSSVPVWAVQNQGNAAAVNIRIDGAWAGQKPNETLSFSHALNPLPVNGYATLKNSAVKRLESCIITYSSLDGRDFWTEIKNLNGELELTFHH